MTKTYLPFNKRAEEHPERALVHRAIEQKESNLLVETDPFAIALGMRLLSAELGKVRTSFQVGTLFIQGNGVIQGGIVSAMLDYAMIFAAFTQIEPEFTLATVSQTNNFFRPVWAGEVFAEAHVEKVGRSLIHTRAFLFSKTEEVLATATAPIAIIPLFK